MDPLAPLKHHKVAYEWVASLVKQLQPENVHVCDGSEEENASLIELLLARGTIIKLNEEKRKNCYLARSTPLDVARVEQQTYICSEKKEDAGPTNNWIDPKEMKATLDTLFTV